MNLVGHPGQRRSRSQYIESFVRAKSAAGGGALFFRVLRAARIWRVPGIVGVPLVLVRWIVFLWGWPSPRDHGFDDQIEDLFLAEVVSAVTVRASVAASGGETANAIVSPAAAVTVTRRTFVRRNARS